MPEYLGVRKRAATAATAQEKIDKTSRVNPRTMARKPDMSMMTMRMTSSQEMGMARGSSSEAARDYHDSRRSSTKGQAGQAWKLRPAHCRRATQSLLDK